MWNAKRKYTIQYKIIQYKTNELCKMIKYDTNHMWQGCRMNHVNKQVDINESCAGKTS